MLLDTSPQLDDYPTQPMWGRGYGRHGGWLRSLGLDQYEANFRDNKIDVDVLADLTGRRPRRTPRPLTRRPQASAQGNS